MRRLILLMVMGLMGLSLACHGHGEGHDHSKAHPPGHDHHADDHGHGDSPTVAITLWNRNFELFAEHPAAVVNAPVSFLIHLTTLKDFRSVDKGVVTLELDGPAPLRGEVIEALRPGIFKIEVTPKAVGKYSGRLRINGPASGVIEGIKLEVFKDEETAHKSIEEHEEHGLISFLKEQQWRVPFETAFASSGKLVSSVQVAGRVDTPPDGRAVVSTPVTGRLVVPKGGLPRPGTKVRKGQVLATLIPAPSAPEGSAQAALAVAEAKARTSAAQAALRRARGLIKAKAIPRREFEDARRETQVARESVRAARRTAAFYSGASGAETDGTWRLTAPIQGTVVAVQATPGRTVSPGETLFEIIDTRETWIVARVPEQDAGRVRPDRDASFKILGLDSWNPIGITGPKASASLVTIGQTVDRVSRTVDVIYALNTPNAALRIGGLVYVNLPAGQDFEGIVIPRSALIDQEGRTVVYVQEDGEHFSERAVRIGPRAGDGVGILGGLKAGERIVTKGAHLIRLADRSRGGQAHGHIH